MTAGVSAPAGRPAASGVALVLGVALVGVAVVSVHDLAVDQGWATDPSWTGSLLDRLDGLTAGAGVVAAGIALTVVGVLVLVAAVKPAPRTHEATPGGADLWVTPHAVRALAVGAAEDTTGVESARARHRRGRLSVTVQSDRPDADSAVEASVRESLAGLTTRDIVVTTEKVKHDS
ncbi:MAG: DUF6286 domain-containing protein [Aeromicrobium sp.]